MGAMRIDIVTVFPEMVQQALSHSIVKRAMNRGLVSIHVVNLRDFTFDRHKTTDDVPYGGGGGMVMKIEPITRALVSLTASTIDDAELPDKNAVDPSADEPTPEQVTALLEMRERRSPRVILTDPRGVRFDQQTARQWARESHLIVLCGHYEGVDDRVRQHLVTDEVSIGDYVLTGGELPALVIVDAVTRLQAGALGDTAAPDNDTFSEDLLEYPHFTRPHEYLGWKAPDILLSGHHAIITRWRRWHQLRETYSKRPDLFEKLQMSPVDEKLFQGPEPTPPDNH